MDFNFIVLSAFGNIKLVSLSKTHQKFYCGKKIIVYHPNSDFYIFLIAIGLTQETKNLTSDQTWKPISVHWVQQVADCTCLRPSKVK